MIIVFHKYFLSKIETNFKHFICFKNIKPFLHLNEYLYNNRNLILMQSTRTCDKHMLQFIIIENIAYVGEKSLFCQNIYIFN